MNDKLTSSELKRRNRNLLYRTVYTSKEITRQELAHKLQLSLPTINQNLRELVEEGLLEIAGSSQSTGGRKPQVIRPVCDAKVAIGIDIKKTFVQVILIDLYGVVMDYEKYVKNFSPSEEYGRYLQYLTTNILKHNNIDKEKLLGVGVAIPGVFSEDAKSILKAPSLGMNSFALDNLLKFFECPVLADNDANGGAFTELMNSEVRENKIYISVEKGVGGCIIRFDDLEKGSHLRAGEFGHMTIVPKGRTCNCGKKGCLEAYITTARISDDYGCQIEDFFSELEAGNKKYQEAWEEYLTYFCIGINNIYTIFDSPVILGGVLTQYLEPYMESIKERLTSINSFEASGDYFRIAKYHSKATAVGVALEHVKKYIDEI